jgi:hypothetical protein
MSYSNLINNSLNLAFRQLKDLAVMMEYTHKTMVDFNFGTSETSEDISTFSAETVIIETKVGNKERSTISMQLMANTKDIGNIENFDSVVYQNETWKIVDNVKTNGFISLFTVIKETSNG